MCARCHALYQRFWRLKNKPAETFADCVALVQLGCRLMALALGFPDGGE